MEMQIRKSEKETCERETVVITGASSGIGRATARLFARQGYSVFGASRRKLPDEDAAVMLELDVRSEASVEHCVAEILARAGRVDVLVNNAGVMHMGFAEETKIEDARAIFETNFFGVVRMTDALLPHMRSRRQGRIINVGSSSAWVGEPGEAFYSASKRALAGYTEALRHEVWPLGIHVSLIEPGAFRTEILQAASSNKGSIADYGLSRQAAHRTMQDALKTGGDPQDVGRVILNVARARSPRFRYAVGLEAHWLPYLKVLLPQGFFDWLLRRSFGLVPDKAKPKA